MSDHRFTVSLEDGLYDALQAEAQRSHRSLSGQAAYCIDQCLRSDPGSAFNARGTMQATAEEDQ